jgi:hypothetical protein
MQALFVNRVPPSSRFFFNSGPKKVLSLSLNVKCDMQTHKKMMSRIMASIYKKSSNKVPIIIFRCYIMGDEPIITEQFFMGSRRLLWVRLWEVKILRVWIMGVTLVSWQIRSDQSLSSLPLCIYSKFNITFQRGEGSLGTSSICPHDLYLSIIHDSKP